MEIQEYKRLTDLYIDTVYRVALNSSWHKKVTLTDEQKDVPVFTDSDKGEKKDVKKLRWNIKNKIEFSIKPSVFIQSWMIQVVLLYLIHIIYTFIFKRRKKLV